MKPIAISPTYNEKKNINELIQRVLASYDDIEILIVDDNFFCSKKTFIEVIFIS